MEFKIKWLTLITIKALACNNNMVQLCQDTVVNPNSNNSGACLNIINSKLVTTKAMVVNNNINNLNR